MATVTLNKGNFVIIGFDENNQYVEKFGVILDYTNEDGGWVKVKNLVSMNDLMEINEIQQYSVSTLGSASKLQTFEKDNGERVYEDLKSTIRRNSEISQERVLESRTRPPMVQTVPYEALRPEVVDTDIEDSPVYMEESSERQDSPIQSTPPNIVYDEISLGIEANVFTIGLDGGDMKTILKIAEESPDIVFNIIDNAMKNNGHITLQYIPNYLRKTFITLKINDIQEFNTTIIEPNTLYKINSDTESGYFKFLGKDGNGRDTWLCKVERGFEKLISYLNIIPDNYFDGYLIEEITDPNLIGRINNDFSTVILSSELNSILHEYTGVKPIKSKRNELKNLIDSDDLGDAWEKAITLYYFMGGELDWDNVDYSTFKTASSLKKLAIAKRDTEIQKKLESV